MQIDAEGFVKRFPEFRNLGRDFIELVLEEAKTELEPTIWREKHAMGVLYLTADKIASSPIGESSRLMPSEQGTMYRKEFERLGRSLGFGMVVI